MSASMKGATGLDRIRGARIPPAGSVLVPAPQREGPLRVRWARLACAALITLLLIAPFVASGTTRTVSQEQVLVGSTTGIALSQADDGLAEALTEADAAPDPTTFAAAESLAAGARVSGAFPADLQSSDNASLLYRETSPVQSVMTTFGPTRNGTACAWSSCAEGISSDNVSASSAADLEAATYGALGASLPPGATNLAVEVGFEAYEPSGNDRLSVTVSWDGGATFCSNAQIVSSIPSSDPDTFTYFNFTQCTGHTWSSADFVGDNLYTSFVHVQTGGASETIYLDANVLRVMYRIQAEYRTEVRFDWSEVPAGQTYLLTVEAAVSGENITLQVLTPPSAWNDRHTFSEAGDRTFTYNLTPAELNGGAPAVRFVDVLGPDAGASDLRIDLATVTTTVLGYALDVRHEIAGIDGGGPVLTVKGRVGTPGENFRVSVWNASSGDWNLRLDAVFAPTDSYHNLNLRPEEVDAGVVRVRYTDASLTNAVAGRLELDLVAVATSVPQEAAFPVALAGGIAAAASGFALVLLFVRTRRSPSNAVGTRGRRIFPALPVRARPGTQVLTGGKATASALKSGRSYVVEEDAPVRSLKLLEDLTRMGRSGLFLTGRDPRTASQGFRLRRTRSFRLEDGQGPRNGDSLAPSLETLTTTIEEFLKTNPVGVVLIEGADFLVERNRPRAVVRFLRRLVETVSQGKQILLVSVSPTIVRERGLRAIGRGMDVLRPE